MRLPRQWSMSLSSEFINVRNHGQSRAGRFLVVATLADEALSHSKFGFVTSKKVGKAVMRNLVRRRLRAVVQKHGDFFLAPKYIVTIARWNATTATFHELEKDWIKLARRLDILPYEYKRES